MLKKTKNKKGKTIVFIVEEDESESKSEELDDESLALLTRNFSKILKQIAQRNGSKGNRSQNNRAYQAENVKS